MSLKGRQEFFVSGSRSRPHIEDIICKLEVYMVNINNIDLNFNCDAGSIHQELMQQPEFSNSIDLTNIRHL